jgi:oligoribonuclease
MLGIFLDIETNGLNPFVHRCLEIAIRILDLYSGEEKAVIDTIVFQPLEIWEKSDLDSLKVNGFTYDQVKDGKPEEQVSKLIEETFTKLKIERTKAVFICQNPSFDRIFFSQIIPPQTQEHLKWPYHWLDLASMFWGIHLHKAKKQDAPFPWEIGYSKDQIAQSLVLPKEDKPHRAINGVNHLIACYAKLAGFPFQREKTPQSSTV